MKQIKKVAVLPNILAWKSPTYKGYCFLLMVLKPIIFRFYQLAQTLRMPVTISLWYMYFLILWCYNEKFIINVLTEQPNGKLS